MSKYPISNKKIIRYGNTDIAPIFKNEEVFFFKDGKRPIESFDFLYAIACVDIMINEIPVTIGTTHFPAIDRASRGRFDNVFVHDYDLNYLLGMRNIYESFHLKIKKISGPFIFTADMNNPRGEYLYDQITHELIDQVPRDLVSSIDPNLHKSKNLSLMIDTIMTTPEIQNLDFNVIDGVSDHKSFVMTFNIYS